VFSTGRSGKKHLSRVLHGGRGPLHVYVTHEEEAKGMRTAEAVEHEYRRAAKSTDENTFNQTLKRLLNQNHD